ncbi:MAG: FAD-dependent oxidoreductase [Mycetocola sp.]
MSHHSLTAADVAALKERPRAQVLVVGGGINGIATFRDLALQGVDVALVERNDYCSGASAASSHMIHGGIRYLENGEFRLVKESVTERNGLLSIAPHYVKPLETTIPIFSTFSGILSAPLRFLTHKQGKAKERGAFLIKTGLVLYDSFSRGGGAVPRHVFRGRKSALKTLPRLNPGLKYTATYFDASVHDPERLALDVLNDGRAVGDQARSANYVEAVGTRNGATVLRDRRSGDEFEFTADLVINASGPWTDLTNAALGDTTTYMGGTKGSHIVLDHPELLAATGGREIFFENNDGRIVLIYPLKGKVMVGTTDLEADPREDTVCTDDEIDYFFELISHVFPDIAVSRDQIVYTFSGIRPLPGHGDTAPGFVSRDYRIVDGSADGIPTLSLVGGKWTTFRALAAHLSSEALQRIGVERRVDTQKLAIGGGVGFPRTDAQRQVWVRAHADGVNAARAEQLLERYGTVAAAVIDRSVDEGDAPLSTLPDYSVAEVRYLAEADHVEHLDDIVLRRSSIAFTGQATTESITEIAEIVAPVLGWDEQRREDEITALITVLKDRHRVILTAAEKTQH